MTNATNTEPRLRVSSLHMPSRLSPHWSSLFRSVSTAELLNSRLRLCPVDAPQEEVEPALKVAEAQLPTDPELRWKTEIPILEELKAKARKCDLWNHFLSKV